MKDPGGNQVDEASNGEELLEISLHVVTGTTTTRTMRVRGTIGTTPITILIDTGSTYNFLYQKMGERLALPVDREKSLKVMVADGSRMSCIGVYKEVI